MPHNSTYRKTARPSQYVYGNTARKLYEVPEYTYRPEVYKKKKKQVRQKQQAKKPRHVSEKVLKNRVAATSVGPGFVAFLAITCIVLIFCCISYLQAKSTLTYKIKDVARVESELSQLKEENTAYEAQLTTNIDLNTVKAIAIGRLGMKTPTPDQRKTYKLVDNRSYVRQYISIDAVK